LDELTNSTILIYDKGAIRLGDIVQCSLESLDNITPLDTDNGSSHSQRSWSLFNAMFWPTLMVVIGFVGLFFTSIFLAKDGWKCEMRSVDTSQSTTGKNRH
jgi:hypothetical protein